MNLDNAIPTHAQWKTKLRSAIAKHEPMDLVTLSRDDMCELGQWLHGEGKSHFGQLPAHADCVHKHLVFHREVTRVARSVSAKEYALAEQQMGAGSDYTKASSALSVAFLQLRKQAGI